MTITIHPPGNAFSVWLLEREVTSAQLATAIGYSLQAVKSWRQSHAVGSARVPHLGALHLIAQRLAEIGASRGERESRWLLSPSDIVKLMRTPAGVPKPKRKRKTDKEK